MANRLKPTDTLGDVIAIIANGNPGAMSVINQIIKKNEKELYVYLLQLDSYGIYGNDLWMLYKDVCGGDVDKTMGCIKHTWMGLISEEKLKAAIRGDETINLDDIS